MENELNLKCGFWETPWRFGPREVGWVKIQTSRWNFEALEF